MPAGGLQIDKGRFGREADRGEKASTNSAPWCRAFAEFPSLTCSRYVSTVESVREGQKSHFHHLRQAHLNSATPIPTLGCQFPELNKIQNQRTIGWWILASYLQWISDHLRDSAALVACKLFRSRNKKFHNGKCSRKITNPFLLYILLRERCLHLEHSWSTRHQQKTGAFFSLLFHHFGERALVFQDKT